MSRLVFSGQIQMNLTACLATFGLPSAYNATACAAFPSKRRVEVSINGASESCLPGRSQGHRNGPCWSAPRAVAIAIPAGQHLISIRP